MRKLILFGVLLYVVGYLVFRITQVETWAEDGNGYVIFPEDSLAIYYLFRPLTHVDAILTGMRFHIGPHN